ncbi:MAG: ParB/RepB/Spo0J family partition protein [Acidobacteriota bacterium]
MNKRRALGKGLSSLIPEEPRLEAPGVLQLDPAIIHPSPDQPRKSFDPEQMENLTHSVRAHGLLQPVVVSPDGEGYRLVIGERRWRAAVKAGLARIPAVVREVSARDRLELALVENLQREGLNPVEEARAYNQLVKEFRLSHQALAQRLGKSRAHISNILRILNLTESVQEAIVAGRLSMGHARALAGLADPAAQDRLADRIIRSSLSVRQAEALVARARDRKAAPEGKGAARADTGQDPNVRAAEDTLKEALGTEVRIEGSAQRGRITIRYRNGRELNRLFEILKRAVHAAPPPAARDVTQPGHAPRITGEAG